ncbi:MAG TPA: transporter [Candidatus Udaeobacter sp.]|nr:transporter [Candidatus Udaeobacter sp.]
MPKIPRVLSFAFALATLLLLLRAAPAACDPWLLAPGDHYSSIGGSYFSADSYHEFDGGRHSLWNGGLHEEKSLYSYNEFGWTKGRTFVIGFPFQGVTRRAGSPAADGGRTETGFGDLTVGIRFKIHDGPTALSLEGDWNPPLGYNRNLSPRIGDGLQSASGRLELGAPVASIGFLELEGGYRTYLDKVKPTDQMLAGATLGFWFRRSLLIAGRYEGRFGKESSDTTYRALVETTPQGTTWPSSDAVPGTTNDRVTTHLAGPMLLYRIDDHLDLIAGSMHTASAKNALHVDRFYVAVAVKQTKLGHLRGLAGGTSSP